MLSAFFLLIFYQMIKNKTEKPISIFAKSIIIWNVWSFLLVEVLSCMNLLTRVKLFGGWWVFNIGLLLLLLRFLKRNSIHLLQLLQRKIKEEMGRRKRPKWYLVILSVTGAAVLFLALFTVPYNWDSMTYHLPRIAHWTQNRSVAHYATNDVRQLASPVLAEFINLQVYLYSGRRDILFNMLQAVSYLADAWIIFEIAKKIGTNSKFSAFSAFIFMTMPIAFGEALNTQVDLFAALWLFIFVYYFIDLFEEKQILANKKTVTKVIVMALCISMGYLAKPSVNVAMAVLLIVLFVKCLFCHSRWKELIKLLFTALPFIFLPLLPEWIRNYQTFSSLSDASVGARQLVGTLRPNYLLVNMIKNFAHNLPNSYLYHSEEMVAKAVSVIAIVLGVQLNDPSISEDGLEYIMKDTPVYGHSVATNPLVVILSIICTVLCFLRIKNNKSVGDRYSLYSIALFVIFCIIVRWEPYVSRYMLPYLGLLCPLVGFQLQEMTLGDQKQIGRALVPVSYFLCFMTLISLVLYHCERLLPKGQERAAGYFFNDQGMYPEYVWVFSRLEENGCQTMGIKVSPVNFEYPMWRFSKYTMTRIENVMVENVSSRYEDLSYIPDCVIMDKENAQEEIVVHGQKYYVPEEFENNQRIAVYIKSKENG